MKNNQNNNDIEFSDNMDEDKLSLNIPKEKRNLLTQHYDKSVKDLVNMVNEKEIIIDVDYQRNYLWSPKTASLLIESIILSVPIPPVYMAEGEDNKWAVIDGLQRLVSLYRFYNNKLKLTGLEVLSELSNLTYDDLPDKSKRLLNNGIIRVILILKESHPEIKYDVFMRLNRGSVKLNAQELRNCLYRGHFNNMLKELRKNKKFLEILKLKSPHKRFTDAELILRFFAMSDNFDEEAFTIKNYPSKMKTFLNTYMEKNRNLKSERYKNRFISTINKVYNIFGVNAFRKINKKGEFETALNRALMDVIMLSFERYDILPKHKKNILNLLKNLINRNKEFNEAITSATSDISKINTRLKVWFEKLPRILK